MDSNLSTGSLYIETPPNFGLYFTLNRTVNVKITMAIKGQEQDSLTLPVRGNTDNSPPPSLLC